MSLDIYPAPKDPDSIIDYGFNWGGKYGFLADTEEIVSSTWFISSDVEAVPTLIVALQGFGISADLKSTYIWLSGGTLGVKYTLNNRIITSDNGRTEDRSAVISCEEK